MPEEETAYKCDLFVSYSTDPDYRLVRKLESFLESFHKIRTPGTVTLRRLQICVDGSDFSLTRAEKAEKQAGSIPDVLEHHLQQCADLLVICSANSCNSIWVGREIQWFLENRGPGSVRLAVSEGEDLGRQPDSVFSEVIIKNRLHEQIWYDFRGYRGKVARNWRKVHKIDAERVRLAADLNGKPAGDILPLWYQEQRRRTRNRAAIGVITATALILLITVAVHLYFAAASSKKTAQQSIGHIG